MLLAVGADSHESADHRCKTSHHGGVGDFFQSDDLVEATHEVSPYNIEKETDNCRGNEDEGR